jgi:hypothetical protein
LDWWKLYEIYTIGTIGPGCCYFGWIDRNNGQLWPGLLISRGSSIWSRIVRIIVIEACLTISHSLSCLELLSEWIAINRLYIYLSWIVFTIGFGRVSILFVRIRHRIGRDVSIGRHIHTCVCSYMYDQAYLHVEMSLAYSCSPIGAAIIM